MSNKHIYAVIIMMAAAAVFCASISFAQPPPPDASRATRESDRFGGEQQRRVERELRKAPQKPSGPAPAIEKPKEGENKFFVKKITLVGCETFPPEDFELPVKKYENKDITLTELNNLAKEIAAEYLKKGVIAAVFVPPQEVKENAITLQVVEARMGELDIQKPRFFNKKTIAYYWHIKPGEVLRYDRMSKSLQLMNKNPDREIKASLHAGKSPGTTDVILTPKTRFPIHFQYTFDREGIMTTGKERNGFGLRDNNVLGLDDTLIMGMTYGKNFVGDYIYHSLPLSGYGTSFMYGYSYSFSKPRKDFDVYAMKSQSQNTTLSVTQDIYNKDEYLGSAGIGFDARDKVTWYKQAQGTLNKDRLRVFNVNGNFVFRGVDSVTYITPELDQGINGLGASKRNNPLASRVGATADYTKFLFTAQNRTNLPFNLQQSLKFRTQLASQELFSQEQFGLGGMDTVRGYPPSDYLADKMVLFNAEMLTPPPFMPKEWKLPYAEKPLRDQLTGVMFFDYGYGEQKGNPKPFRLASVGTGIRMSFYNQVMLRLEWGFPLKLLGMDPLTEGTAKCPGRFHFSLNIEDKIPSEIERIVGEMRQERKEREAWALIDAELNRPGSVPGRKLREYIESADELDKKGRLKEARQKYALALNMGKLLYSQAQKYIEGCPAHEEELMKKNDEALALFRDGKYAEAKKTWQEVEKEAEPRPLDLEF